MKRAPGCKGIYFRKIGLDRNGLNGVHNVGVGLWIEPETSEKNVVLHGVTGNGGLGVGEKKKAITYQARKSIRTKGPHKRR